MTRPCRECSSPAAYDPRIQVLDPICDACYRAQVAGMRERQASRPRPGPGNYGSVSWWYATSGEAS